MCEAFEAFSAIDGAPGFFVVIVPLAGVANLQGLAARLKGCRGFAIGVEAAARKGCLSAIGVAARGKGEEGPRRNLESVIVGVVPIPAAEV